MGTRAKTGRELFGGADFAFPLFIYGGTEPHFVMEMGTKCDVMVYICTEIVQKETRILL